MISSVFRTCKLLIAIGFVVACGQAGPPAAPTGSPLLMHDVYLDLNDNLGHKDYAWAIEMLHGLRDIEGVHDMWVGKRAETGDPRLDGAYDLALHVVFVGQDDLKNYDQAPKHQEIRLRLKPFLAAPPRVFDYWTH